MKKLFYTFYLLIFFSINSFGQEQWAANLIKYSSQAGFKAFGAKQVIGSPNALQYGKNPVSWSPEGANAGIEYIHVGFSNAQKVSQIAVWENFNPGSIYQIFLIEPNGKEHKVFEQQHPVEVTSGIRMFYHTIKLTDYLVSELKLVLNTAEVIGLNQIDAIGISSSNQPMLTRINNSTDKNFIGKPENLGYSVNSESPDMLPLISVDGQTLYFARKYNVNNIGPLKKDDIYVSHKDSKSFWKEAYNIGPPLNDEYNNFVCAVNPDGTEILVSGWYDQGEGLYRTSYINGKWTNPKKIIIEEYDNKSPYVCYHVSPNMKYLVIAMEDQATYGDMDIYVSFRKSDGLYTKPKNLGPVINTAGTEPSVFLSADEKTIYFSSDGQPGYGAYDMFMSRRLDNSWNQWSEPINLGPKINTIDWELYYTVPANGEYAYYSSANNSYGESDLYRIKLPKDVMPEPVAILKPNFINVKTNTPVAKLDKLNTTIIINEDSKVNLFEEIKGFYPVNESEDLSAQLEEEDSYANPSKNKEEIADPLDTKMNDLLSKLQKLKNEQAKTDNQINKMSSDVPITTSSTKQTNVPATKNINYSSDLDDKLAALRSDMDKINNGVQPKYSYKEEVKTNEYKVKPATKYQGLEEKDAEIQEALEDQLKKYENNQKSLENYNSASKYNTTAPRDVKSKEYDLRTNDQEEFISAHQDYRDRIEELKMAKEKSAFAPEPLSKYTLKKTLIDEDAKDQLVAGSLKNELADLKEKQILPQNIDPEVEAYRLKLEQLKSKPVSTTLPTTSGKRITTTPKSEISTTGAKENESIIVDPEVLAYQQKLEDLKTKLNKIPNGTVKELEQPVAVVTQPEKGIATPINITNTQEPKQSEIIKPKDKNKNVEDNVEIADIILPSKQPISTVNIPASDKSIGKNKEEEIQTENNKQKDKNKIAEENVEIADVILPSIQPISTASTATTTDNIVGKNKEEDIQTAVNIPKDKNKNVEDYVEIADVILPSIQPISTASTATTTDNIVDKNKEEDIQKALDETNKMNEEIAEAVQHKEALKIDIDRLNEETAIANKALDDAKQLNDELEKNKQAIATEKARLEADKLELENQKKDLQAILDQLQKEKDQFAADQIKQNNERDKLEAIRLSQYKEVKKLESDIKNLEQEKGKITSEVLIAKQNEPVKTTPLVTDQEIFLMPVEEGVTVEIRNIFFNANAAYVKSESYTELDKIATFLKVNSTIIVEIGGHTNGLCDDDFCFNLSTNRAKAVADYLINKGIPAQRIQFKGYGKSQPIADNSTSEGKKKNQRVELKILKII